MINFVNKGTDEALLKSLQSNPNVDQEVLQKAIDKSKLVQVETTVQGKNKTFTRKQWKKAGDVKSTDRVIGGQQPTKEDNKPKLNDKTVKVKPEDIKIGDYVKVSNNEGAGGIISVQKVTEINKSTLRGITVYHFNHSSKMRFAGRAGSSTIEKYVVEDSATTTKNADDKSKPKDDGDKPIQSKYKVGDKGMITTKGGTTIPVKVIGVTMNYKDEVVYEVRENRVLSGNHSPQDYRVTEKGFKPLQNNSKAGGNTDSSKSPVSSMPDSIGSLKKDSDSGETWYEGTMGGHRVRILQEDAGKSDWWNIEVDGKLVRTDNNKAMAFQSVKDAHDELKEQTSKQSNGPKVLDSADGFKTGQEVMYNDHKVKIEKITEGYGGKALFDVSKDGTRMAMTLESKDLKAIDKQPATPQSQKANYFKAEQATKNKVNDMSKQMGNDKLLQYAKDNGVTWKENDHKAINIMRMKMALAQAIQEGKIKDSKSAPDPDKNPGGEEQGQPVPEKKPKKKSNKPTQKPDDPKPGDGDKKDDGYEIPDEKDSAKYGKKTQTYRDGTVGYEKKDDFSKEEAKEHFHLMDNVIKANFVEQMSEKNVIPGISRSNIEFDKDSGIITAWVDNATLRKFDPSTPKRKDFGGKVFFSVNPSGTRITNVKPDGKVKSYFKSGAEYKFSVVGTKL